MGTIGILAVQGDFEAHRAMVESLGHQTLEIRTRADLDDSVQGLVLPGGESSAQLKLLATTGLDAIIAARARTRAFPVLATCAGCVLIARRVENPDQRSFNLLDIVVARNGWGSQVHSFEARGERSGRDMVFIRAPRIRTVGDRVEVLETLDREPVAVRQGRVVAATFHPELSGDATYHEQAFGRASASRN